MSKKDEVVAEPIGDGPFLENIEKNPPVFAKPPEEDEVVIVTAEEVVFEEEEVESKKKSGKEK